MSFLDKVSSYVIVSHFRQNTKDKIKLLLCYLVSIIVMSGFIYGMIEVLF